MRLCLLVLTVIGLYSCKSEQSPGYSSPVIVPEVISHDTTDTQHDSIIQNKINDSVLFSFTYTDSRCNGSYPSDDVLAEIRKPRRLYDTPLILKADHGLSYFLNTDKKGRSKTVIPAGHYTLHFDANADYEKSPVLIRCDLYFEPTWGEIEIHEDQNEVTFNVELPCDLCDEDVKKRP